MARGNRRLGESSTVTVMRYERSEDDFFHVRLPNDDVKAGLTGEQLEGVLQSIRFNVEAQGSYSVEPVVIEIPLNFFENRDVHITIIDLPGVESAELKEVEHVKQCIKHWLPLSEVCLLVDDATQLTAFTEYTLKGIKNWYEQLSNFRVIPTRALTLDNIRKSIESDAITTAEGLIADYAKVLNRVLKMDLDLTKTIYPIEIGTSWDVIREKEPDLYGKMKPIMEEIFLDLQKDLENLDVNELSFNRLTKLYKEAEEASKFELEQQQVLIEKHETLMDNQTFLFEQEGKEAQQQYDDLCSEVKIYDDFFKKIRFQDVNPDLIKQRVHEQLEYSYSNRKASAINEDASKLQLSVETELETKLWEIRQEAGRLNISMRHYSGLPSLYPIPRIEQRIDAFWLQSSYEKAFYSTSSHAYDWVKEMYENFNTLLKPIYYEVKSLVEMLEKQAADMAFMKEENRKKHEKLVAQYQRENDDLVAGYQKIYQEWNQDQAHASQLQSYFIKYWMDYKEELQQYFLYGNEDERWLASNYLQLLVQDGKKIIESLN